ncbi:hypothetical protein MJT46_018322 [Ovis ammon polii x Ovis aries]|nr:hypothetical protein MJT46_018322 [Ovis ammon polii x Ovis aries]
MVWRLLGTECDVEYFNKGTRKTGNLQHTVSSQKKLTFYQEFQGYLESFCGSTKSRLEMASLRKPFDWYSVLQEIQFKGQTQSKPVSMLILIIHHPHLNDIAFAVFSNGIFIFGMFLFHRRLSFPQCMATKLTYQLIFTLATQWYEHTMKKQKDNSVSINPKSSNGLVSFTITKDYAIDVTVKREDYGIVILTISFTNQQLEIFTSQFSFTPSFFYD